MGLWIWMMIIAQIIMLTTMLTMMKMFIAMSWDREKELTDDGRRTLAIQLFPPFSHHDEDLDDFVKLKNSYRQYVGNIGKLIVPTFFT